MTAMEGTSFLHADNSDRSISFGAPDWEQLFRGGIFTAEEAISDAMKERGDLQDKQDKSTARTANNGKNQILGPVVCRASIYGLSEAVEPLF